MSGSANHTKSNANAYGFRFLIQVSRIFYADPRCALGPYRTVRTPSSGSNWATNSSYERVPIIRHLVGTRECHPLSHLRTMVILCGSGTPQTTSTIFYYHFTVAPLNSYGMEGQPFQPGPCVWGASPECLDAWDRFSMLISPRFSDVR